MSGRTASLRIWAPLLLWLGALGALPLPLAARAGCEPIVLRDQDLNEILAAVLGPLRQLAERHEARIEPADQCYVKMSITVRALPPLLPRCEMKACSVALTDGQRIGLRQFDITGCDSAFAVLGVSRRVPTAYADAKPRIRAHCGTSGFVLGSARAAITDSKPAVIVALEPRP
jgi:hypothetical protein